ncbi:hypothetical protein PN419_08705 [Halorubrum ezzemoulense]|uniref:Uncharacterized protein n=2 Tax=Halorubrum ezzemoulense TaxID=337243 RepID=A0A256KY84_HALEZ|nr:MULTISPECIES: hypothetical protein [Halorubrum]MDB2225387.1 hypothetical protein [Halorubrum ezzemoulense]MDB2238746.1 hypothetical protein [Halorubrum ezzemoulense]MDB2239734.1 hypothetical protein [Halorubrum ezzemoulense]MDB2244314.1 hypothetical protein [Halorubrum ezzemoulense]MDB2248054.1 hypothetical protein [Halorubrum ezzemoulense]
MSREYGETWVYESLVGGIPGLGISRTLAVALQFVIFEVGVVALGWYYGVWNAVAAGTVAVVVAAVGSVEMHRLGAKNRLLGTPPEHKRLLFGSSIEIVLGVLAFIALVTYLFAWDGTLINRLFGADPPIPVVYLTLLVLWDLTYRIGTSWWSAVVALWRAVHVDLPSEERATVRRLDAENIGFSLVQLALVPFLLSEPVLLGAVVGHVIAVALVCGAAILLT